MCAAPPKAASARPCTRCSGGTRRSTPRTGPSNGSPARSTATRCPTSSRAATSRSASSGSETCWALAADGGHRPVGLLEVGVVDAVPGLLSGERGDEPAGQLVVVGPRPHRHTKVTLRGREQAVAQLTVGREPDPVAVPAERTGHRADHADAGLLLGPA